jgi:hypothetical protein
MASVKQWAQLGAARRVEEITAELADIERMFPELRSRRRVQDGGAGGNRVLAGGRKVRRRRKPMSAAQKRAVGIRMKKYWAARRKAEA